VLGAGFPQLLGESHGWTLLGNDRPIKGHFPDEGKSVSVSALASFPPVHKSHAMPQSPEADPRFHDFVLMQAQNAGLFLGQIPNPATGEKSVNLRAAKSVIDSLGMLRKKTAGNLTETEEKLLEMAIKNLLPLYKTALNESES